jgi:hypothetical protein
MDTIRSFNGEFRSTDDGHIKGYPLLFEVLSQDLGGFVERISKGAVVFADDLACDFDHNSAYILGRRSAGTLTATIDDRGVKMDVTPPDTQWARDLLVSIRRSDITGGSFQFRVLNNGSQITEENGRQVRNLTHILVKRLTITSNPAYLGTAVEVRSKIKSGPSYDFRKPFRRSAPKDVLRRKLEIEERA